MVHPQMRTFLACPALGEANSLNATPSEKTISWMKYFVAYAATAVSMLALDVLWIGFIAKPMYQTGIGHLMAEQPKLWIAACFYLVYAAGLMHFAVQPYAATASLGKVAMAAALFGFFAYATYDLTNWATLKNWPARVALADMAWGSFASAVSAVAGAFTSRLMPAN
jgi:uncharacterized membrane protein